MWRCDPTKAQENQTAVRCRACCVLASRSCATCTSTRELLHLEAGDPITNPNDRFSIITVVSGELTFEKDRLFQTGDFFILPRGAGELVASNQTRILQTYLPIL